MSTPAVTSAVRSTDAQANGILDWPGVTASKASRIALISSLDLRTGACPGRPVYQKDLKDSMKVPLISSLERFNCAVKFRTVMAVFSSWVRFGGVMFMFDFLLRNE